MKLSKWHSTRVKPTVKNFRSSLHYFSAFRTSKCDIINCRLVQIKFCFCINSPKFFEFFNTTNNVNVTIFTNPEWKRCSPISISCNIPINKRSQETTHSSFTDCFWTPINTSIVFQKFVFHCCSFYKPAASSIINKWCFTSPTEWIRVSMRHFF